MNGTYQTWDSANGKVLAVTDTKPEILLLAPNKRSVSYTKDYDKVLYTAPDGTKKDFRRYGNNSAFDTSTNGEMFAEGGRCGDAAIKITEFRTGRAWFLEGQPGVIAGLAFTPDGRFLFVGGRDRNVYILDTQDRKIIDNIPGGIEPIKSLVLSPDGKLLLVVTGDGISVWDWQARSLLDRVGPVHEIYRVTKTEFSRDGRYFLLTDEEDLRVWEMRNWRYIAGFKTAEKYESSSGEMSIGHDHVPVSSATFIGNGKEIVSSHVDGTWRIWNTSTGKEIRKLNHGENSKFLVGMDDEKVISVGSGKERNNEKLKISILDLNKGTIQKRFDEEDTSYIENIALSPNGREFVTTDIGGDVYLWNPERSKPVRNFDIDFSGNDAIAFSPDGKMFAVGGKNQNVFLFDVRTGEKLWQLIPSYRPGELEKELEGRGRKGREEVEARKTKRDQEGEVFAGQNKKKIFARFSHYGDAESFWDQKIAESGKANKSLLRLPKDKASVAWFKLTNDSDLPVSIKTNSMIFNPKCKGLCDGAEISSRYVLELKDGKTDINGFDVYSTAILPPKTTVYFSVSLEHFKNSKAIYLGFTFQKDDPDDDRSNDYGTEQKVYLRESDLPK